jgi:hypothetical protein
MILYSPDRCCQRSHTLNSQIAGNECGSSVSVKITRRDLSELIDKGPGDP